MNKSEDVVVTVDAGTNPAFLTGQLLSSVRVMQDEEALERRLQQVEAEGASRVSRIALPQDRGAFLQFVREWEQKHKRAVGMGTVAMLVLPLAACGGGGGGGGGTVPTDSGWVVDGYVTGTTVSREDGSGNTYTTGADGRFTGLTGTGVMVAAAGGTDVATGEAINFVMRAPDNATVISPLTTLVQALIDGGMTETAANTAVINALGLPVATNLLTTDPWASPVASLELIKAGAQVANILTIGVAEGANSTLLASKIAAALVPGVDLSDAATIQSIFTAAGLTNSVDTLAATVAKENVAVDAAADAAGVSAAQKLPMATISLADSALKAGETTTVTVTFSEKPTGFDAAVDLTVANGTLSDDGAFDASGLIYTVTFTPTDDLEDATNVVTLGTGWTDAAGNAPSASTDSANYVIDTREPTQPLIAAVAGDDKILADEADAGVSVSGVAEAGASVTITLGSGNERTVTADGTGAWRYDLVAADYTAMGEGAETVTVVATDAAGNASVAATRAINIDTVRPTLTVTLADSALIAGETSLVTFKFSEAPLNFSLADVTLNSGSVELTDLTSDAQDPTRYTAVLRATKNLTDADSKIAVGTDWTNVAGNSPAALTESANYTVTAVSPLVVNKLLPTGANSFNTLAEALAVSQPGDLLQIAGGSVVATVAHSAGLATLGGITLLTGTSLTLSAEQADSVPTIAAGGDANVVLTALDGVARDLSTVTVANGQFSAVVSSNLTLDPATQLGVLTVGVQNGAALTLSAAQAASRAISGLGAVEVTALDLSPAANLSQLSTSTAHATVTESLTFTGTLGKVALSIAGGKVLTTTAAIADGKTMDGAGTVSITALQGTPAADLSGLTAADVNAAVTTVTGTPVVFTGKLGNADVAITGNGELQLAAGATLGSNASFDVAANNTLSAAAAQLSGKTVTGAGAVTVSALAADSDLSGFDAGLAVTATVASAIDISANANLASVDRYTLQAGTLTLSATQANGTEIDGSGTVNVSGLAAGTDLSGVADGLTLNVAVGSTVDISANANLATVDSYTVSAGTLTLSAAQADGVAIGGAGAVAVVGVESSLAADLSSITTSSVSAAVLTAGTMTFTGSFGNAAVTVSGTGTLVLDPAADFSAASFQVNTGATLQAAAADLPGVTITGNGNVVVDNLIATSDLSSIDPATNLTANVASSVDLGLNTTLAAVDQYVVALGQTLTLTAAQANGKTITGLGSVVITDVDATPAADLDGVSASGGVSIVVDADTAFTGTLATNAAFSVNAATQLTLDATLVDARVISGAGELKVSGNIASTDFSGLSTTSIDLTAAVLGGRTELVLNETSQFVVTPAQTLTLAITGTAGSNTLIVDVSALDFGTQVSPVVQSVKVQATTLGGNDTVTFRFGGVPGEDWRTVELTADSYLRFGDGFDTLQISNGTLDMSLPAPGDIDFEDLVINSVLTVSGNLLQFLLNRLGAAAGGLSGGGTINVTSAPSSGVIDLDKFGTFTAGGVTPPTIVFPASFVDGNNDPVFFKFTPPADGGLTVNIQIAGQPGLWYDGSQYLSKDITVYTAQQLIDAVARDAADDSKVDSITLGQNVTLNTDLDLSGQSLTLVTAAGKQLLLGSSGALTLSVAQADEADIAGLGRVIVVAGPGVTTLAGIDFAGIIAASTLTVQGTLDATTSTVSALGKFKLVVETGGELTVSYDQATLRSISGNGDLIIKGATSLTAASADFSKLAASLNVTAVIDSDLNFVGTLTGVDQLQVLTGKTLTASAALLDGRTITGDGNVAVRTLGLNTDLSQITVTGTKTATVSSNLTFNGNLGDFDVAIASLRTLTTSASRLDGVDVSGGGKVVVLLNQADADLDGVLNAGSKTATVESPLNFTGTLANGFAVIVTGQHTLTTTTTALNLANVTVSGTGAVTLNNIGATDDLTRISVTGAKLIAVSADADYRAAKLGGFALDLATGVDLTLSAAQADARSISGTGHLIVDGLELTPAASLNRIDVGQLTVKVNDSVEFSGELANDASKVTLEVSSGSTLTSSASILDGAAITGAGNVVVTGIDDALSADLGRIAVTGSKTLQIDTSVALGDGFVLPQGFAIQMVGAGELIASAAQLHGVSVTGSGNVIVTDLGAASDLSKIAVSGLVLAEVTSSVEFAGQLPAGMQLIVAQGSTLTVAPETLDGVFVFGEGNVTLTGIAAGVDLSQLLVSGMRAIEITTDADLRAVDLGDFELRLADGVELTLSANQVLGRSIQVINENDQAFLKIIGLGAQTVESLGANIDLGNITLAQGPKVTITTPIAVDDVINAAEAAAGVTVSGTATGADGQVLKLNVAGTELSTVVSNGAWSLTVPANVLRGIADATWTLSAQVTDTDGNTGTSAPVSFAVDTAVPTLQIDPVTADGIIIRTEAQSGFSVTGTAVGVENGQVVSVSLNGKTYQGEVQNGLWSVTVSPSDAAGLADGSYTVSANVSDVAGNPAVEASRAVTVALNAPAISIDPVAADNVINLLESGADLTLAGTTINVENGRTVSVSFNGKTYTAVVDAVGTDGVWSLQVPKADFANLINGGNYVVSANVSNAVGLAAAPASQTVSTDLLAPVVGIPTIAGDNVINIADKAAGVLISGTAEPGAEVTLLRGEVTVSKVSASSSGFWSYQLTAADYEAIGQGEVPFRATATDAAGNTSAPSDSLTLRVDTVAPSYSSAPQVSAPENQNLLYTAQVDDIGARFSLQASGDHALLVIDPVSGVVSLASGNLNHENKASYSFTVIATDSVGNTTTQLVSVAVGDLNDNAPVFTSGATGSVDENALTATPIYTALAPDADGTEANNTVRYSLKSGLSDDAGLLNIDPTSGAVTLKSAANFEQKASYSFTVLATDNGTPSLSAEKAVTVSVSDVNEVLPLNLAQDATQMGAALLQYGVAMGFDLAAFNALTQLAKAGVAADLLANRPLQGGYANEHVAEAVFDGIVAVYQSVGATVALANTMTAATPLASLLAAVNASVDAFEAASAAGVNTVAGESLAVAIASGNAAINSFGLLSPVGQQAFVDHVVAGQPYSGFSALLVQSQAGYQLGVAADTVAPVLSLVEDTGSSSDDGITANGEVQVTKLLPGATWKYSLDGGTSWTEGVGTQFVVPEGVYAAGEVRVQQTNVVGTLSLPGQFGAITIDDTAPAKPTINSAVVDVAVIELALVAEAGSRVEIRVGDQVVGSETLDTAVSGTRTFQVTLQGGNNALSVTVTDVAGNVSDVATKTVFHDPVTPLLAASNTAADVLAALAHPFASAVGYPVGAGSAFAALSASRQLALANDLLANGTAEQDTAAEVIALFDAVVSVRSAMYASLDAINAATSADAITAQTIFTSVLDALQAVPAAVGLQSIGGQQVSFIVSQGELAVTNYNTLSVADQAAFREALIAENFGSISQLLNFAVQQWTYLDGLDDAALAAVNAASSADAVGAALQTYAARFGIDLGAQGEFADLEAGRQQAVFADLLANRANAVFASSYDTLAQVKALFDADVTVRNAMEASLDAINAAQEADAISAQTIFTDVLAALKAVPAAVGLTSIGGQEVSLIVSQGEQAVTNYNALSATDQAAFRAALVNAPDFTSIPELLNFAVQQWTYLDGLDDAALAAVNAASSADAVGAALQTYAARFGIDLGAEGEFADLDAGRQQAVFADLLANRANTAFGGDFDSLAQVKALFDADVTVRTAMEASLDAINAAQTADAISAQTIFTDVLTALKAVPPSAGLVLISGQPLAAIVAQGDVAVANYNSLSLTDQAAFRAALVSAPDFSSIETLLVTAQQLYNNFVQLDVQALAAVNAASVDTAPEMYAALVAVDDRFGLDVSAGPLTQIGPQLAADLLVNRPLGGYTSIAQVKALLAASQSVIGELFDSLTLVNAATTANPLTDIAFFSEAVTVFQQAAAAGMGSISTSTGAVALSALIAQAGAAQQVYASLTAAQKTAFLADVSDTNYTSFSEMLFAVQTAFAAVPANVVQSQAAGEVLTVTAEGDMTIDLVSLVGNVARVALYVDTTFGGIENADFTLSFGAGNVTAVTIAGKPSASAFAEASDPALLASAGTYSVAYFDSVSFNPATGSPFFVFDLTLADPDQAFQIKVLPDPLGLKDYVDGTVDVIANFDPANAVSPLDGTDSRDLLIANAGPVEATGKLGADVFAPASMNTELTITDFSGGSGQGDKVDLGMVMKGLGYTALATSAQDVGNGKLVVWQDETTQPPAGTTDNMAWIQSLTHADGVSTLTLAADTNSNLGTVATDTLTIQLHFLTSGDSFNVDDLELTLNLV